MSVNILERTFGVEFEFADVNKKAVSLPNGFSWSKDEVVINTDRSNGSFSSAFGGEINSPPLFISQNDREKLKQVFQNCIKNNGKITWTKAIHIHIYAGDFSLSDLKKVFLLSYYTAHYLKEIADVGQWNDQAWQCPAPTLEYVERVRNSKTEADFFNVFANSMNKGYIRHLVNVPSYFIRKTIEFRCFNNTYHFSEVENAILFSYRFINYALTHTEEDFKQIDSFQKFKRELKFDRPLPKKTEPLIFSGNQLHPHEAFVAKAKKVSSKMIKILSEQCGNELACVNPFLYHTELNLYEKTKLTIYNSDEFNHIFYRIFAENFKIKYCKTFDFLEEVNNETPQRQMACLLLFSKMRKTISKTSVFSKKEFQAQIDRISAYAKHSTYRRKFSGYAIR